jgi:hypothetical protein
MSPSQPLTGPVAPTIVAPIDIAPIKSAPVHVQPSNVVPSIRIDPATEVEKAADGKPLFSISAEPRMPVIELKVSVVGVTSPDPTARTQFEWVATLRFDSRHCLHGIAKADWKGCGVSYKVGDTRTTATITAQGKAVGGMIAVEFDQFRGGTLTISVTANVGGITTRGMAEGWRVQGTNPNKEEVCGALPDDTHRKIACAESSMQQFVRADGEGDAWYPNFSADGLLGVGICQITNPPATDDQVWNWRENVNAGVMLYSQKKREAQAYPARVAKSAMFLALVKRYNDGLQKAAKSGSAGALVRVTVPEFDAKQLEDDTIRGFNGWAGDEGFVRPKRLHEFRLKRDAMSGDLIVDGDPATGCVSAIWERVPAKDRPGRGDPNYISDVRDRDPGTCAKRGPSTGALTASKSKSST